MSTAVSPTLWHKQRFWLLLTPHVLVSAALLPPSSLAAAAFEARMAQPQLAFLGERRIAGHAVLSAAVLAEMIAACVVSLQTGAGIDPRALLTNATLPSALLSAQCFGQHSAQLQCHVSQAAGAAAVVAVTGTSQQRSHLQTSLHSPAVERQGTPAARERAPMGPGPHLREALQTASTGDTSPLNGLLASVGMSGVSLRNTAGWRLHPAVAESASCVAAIGGPSEATTVAQWEACLMCTSMATAPYASSQQLSGPHVAGCCLTVRPYRMAWLRKY